MIFWAQIICLVIFIFLSAFFSGSETALTALGKLRTKRILAELEEAGEGGSSFAEYLKYWLDNSQDIIVSILIWNNLVNIAASSLATVVATHLFRTTFELASSMAWGSGTAVGVMTFLILVFGEITPKSYAKQNPEEFARQVITPIILFTHVSFPLRYLLQGFSRFFIHVIGGEMVEEHTKITEEELKKLVLAGRQEGALEETELKMLQSVFDFDETIVREIMVPRTDLIALEVNESYQRVMKEVRQTGLSRIPVYEEKVDNIVGILNIKDFITRCDRDETEQFELRQIVRPPYFVPETKRVNQLLANFRRHRVHMAIVVDEYGGTSGIITLEDILEEIVGEIEDEYDDQRQWVDSLDDDVYLVDARIDLDDLEERLDVPLPSQKYDSLGGMLIEEMGKIPEEGESISYGGNNFEVVEANKRKVKKVRLKINNELDPDTVPAEN